MMKIILISAIIFAFSEADVFDSLRVPKAEKAPEKVAEDLEDYEEEVGNTTNLFLEAWDRAQEKCYPLSDPPVSYTHLTLPTIYSV